MGVHGVLGERTDYPTRYSPEILYPIARQAGRECLTLSADDLSRGADVWHGYEVSWLSRNGIPQVAVLRLSIPASSQFLIESKSLKLYLNSLNFRFLSNRTKAVSVIKKDIEACIKSPVDVALLSIDDCSLLPVALDGECLDKALNEMGYLGSDGLDASKLRSASLDIAPRLYYSHLLRSNCPVTGQPDWGTVRIAMVGRALDKRGLLSYLLSFRKHNGFHEQCVEQIFNDLAMAIDPKELLVQAFYTRRGGLDINPWRMSENYTGMPLSARVARQ